MKKTALISVLIISLLGLSLGYGGPKNHNKRGERWEHSKFEQGQQNKAKKARVNPMHYVIKELDLSKEQLEQIDKLRIKQKESKKDVYKNMQELKREFQSELFKKEVNTRKIETLKKKIIKLTGDLLDDYVYSIMAYRKILTDDQLAKLENIKENLEKRRLERKVSKQGVFGKLFGRGK